ncbi:MAG: hypothetical protein U9R60_04090, partial [Bacteroidota bacterium]|nr:hypothetical protein [Bacteroidota bacterium]
LYGAGKFLRMLEWDTGKAVIPNEVELTSSPEYALRGHQFGYRNTANSWDSWSVEQFDQHFLEQMLFGANSFENIPFQDSASSVHFKVNPAEMEIHLSNICDKYDADYWVWTPAPHDLTVKNAHRDGLDEQEAFFTSCPRLNAVFVPGGDPGDNHPSDLMPYLKDLSILLHKYHPDAGLWVSMQGFEREKVEYFFNYLEENDPDWLTGLVYGPGSPPVDLERKHLPEKYKHRLYPDITHTVRCQYPVKRWDQAFALTLGRECTNPQPLYYAGIHNRDALFTDGFLAYSDGTHDDVNKILWSQLGWNPGNDVRNIMVEYCRFFFGTSVAEEAATGIFALEQNWAGPLPGNKVIGETLALWKKLETENPQLAGNWRWQQLVMRAYYDAYIQERLSYEKSLEAEAYEILAKATTIGADEAMQEALICLQKADKEFVAQDLKQEVVQYGEDLFKSVGAQTSVPKYNASGYERGAVLDFIDYPLNNRWWLEDKFIEIKELNSEDEKLARLEFIRTYENPGDGSFYDNISSADALHVISETDDAIDYLWENDGLSRKRLSTQLFQFSPVLQYDELDPNADYLIRITGYGEALLRANGERLEPSKYDKGFEQFKEFPLPKELITDGSLKITFDTPDEGHLNWRKQSRVTDVWILKL